MEGSTLRLRNRRADPEATADEQHAELEPPGLSAASTAAPNAASGKGSQATTEAARRPETPSNDTAAGEELKLKTGPPAISWAEGTLNAPTAKALRIPSPQERDEGKYL